MERLIKLTDEEICMGFAVSCVEVSAKHIGCSYKTFEELATRGKCFMGWFFGFKFHQIINDKEVILNFMFTATNVDDKELLKGGNFLKDTNGNLCINKIYWPVII